MDKTRKNSSSVGSVLLAAALLLAALAFAEVVSFLAGPARADSIVTRASTLGKPDPDAMQPYLDQTRKTAEALKKQNAFVKQPPKEHPVKQVGGILGSEILVGDKWYRVGDKIGDAKVISIESTQVMIEWDGKTTSFAPLAAAGPERQEPARRPEAAPAKDAAVPKPSAAPVVVNRVEVATPEDDDPFAWAGIKVPDRIRATLMERWNGLTDEQKEEAKREWSNMSDEEKQKAVESLERM
jgi:hypothetical protein